MSILLLETGSNLLLEDGANHLLLDAAQVDNPPFNYPGRSPAVLAITVLAAQPDPWIYAGLGDAQPYAARNLTPTTLNNPFVFVPINPPGPRARKMVWFAGD